MNWTACAGPPSTARAIGLEIHAGHGFNFDTVRTVAAIPQIAELNIGHFLIGRRSSSASTRRAGNASSHGRGPGAGRGRMILGIGSDLCDIRRIERSLERFGDRFTHRIFTEGERARSDRRAARAPSYARRFAAKEACAKALGTGMSRGVFWRDMEVVNLPGGQPDPAADGRRPGAPAGDDAGGARGRRPRIPHRRSAPCAGLRGHRGPPTIK